MPVQSVGLGIATIGFAAWAMAAAIFFRQTILSSFDLTFGDVFDGSMNNYNREHLYQALLGRARFLSPPIYFPEPNVLGYTDALLLDLAPYVPFRILGLDPLLSSQFVMILLSLLCFAATFVICHQYLRVRPWIAIIAALLVTFPNNLFFKATAGHLQLYALHYVPCIALLALWGLQSFPKVGIWSLVRVFAAGLLFGLLFSTSFYTAWMLALTLAFGAVAACVLWRRDVPGLVRLHPHELVAMFGASLTGFAIGLIPFFMIYLPVLSIVPGRPYQEYINFAPELREIFNVGHANLVWGWLMERLGRKNGHEWPLSVTPVVGVAFCILLAVLLRREHRDENYSWQTRFAVCCLAVAIASWLLTLKYKEVSLFWLAYHAVPGAIAIRCGARFQLIVNIWSVLGLAALAERWLDTTPEGLLRYGKVAAAAVAAVCFVEQINTADAARLPRRQQLDWLASVPVPPAECQVILMDPLSKTGRPSYHDTDGMWLTVNTGLPTLNGMSGWSPKGWLMHSDKVDYFEAARRWIAHTKMESRVCLYQRAERRWSMFYRA